jgi:hypothetical protein
MTMDHNPATLTHDECVALSRLTADENAAIAATPSLADAGPAAVTAYLVRAGDGSTCLSRFIEQDLGVAVAALDHAETARLKLALQHFLRAY